MPYNTPNHPNDNTPGTPGTPRKTYHWNAECQRMFLEALACTGSVAKAAKEAGKSPRAAYALRTRKEGALFRLMWDAAILLARDVLGDALLDRAIYGNEEIAYHEGDGQMARVRYDNHLGTRMLTRLDHMAHRQPGNSHYQAHVHAIAGDFETYLDLIECGDMAGIQIMDMALARIELGYVGGLNEVPAIAAADQNSELNSTLSSALNGALHGTLNSALNCELSPISASEATNPSEATNSSEATNPSEANAADCMPDDESTSYKNRAERRADNRAHKRIHKLAKVSGIQAAQIQAERSRIECSRIEL